MGLDVKMRKQFAVYWAPGSIDEHGRNTFADPEELKVRWSDVNERFIGPDGTEKTSAAKVWVGEDLEFGGYLWKGKLADLPENANPEELDGCYLIQKIGEFVDFKAKKTYRPIWL